MTPRNHQTFLNHIKGTNDKGENSFREQFLMLSKVCIEVLSEERCLFIVPSELIIDQIFNSKKNPKPALAVLVDNTLGVVYFKNAVTRNYHGIFNNPIPACLSFEQFC